MGSSCAYREFRPINQHPCGTLIADLVDALSLLASTSESKDWQSLRHLGSFVRHQDHREIGPARHIEFVANDVAVFAGCLRHAGFERAEIACLHVNFSQRNAVQLHGVGFFIVPIA